MIYELVVWLMFLRTTTVNFNDHSHNHCGSVPVFNICLTWHRPDARLDNLSHSLGWTIHRWEFVQDSLPDVLSLADTQFNLFRLDIQVCYRLGLVAESLLLANVKDGWTSSAQCVCVWNLVSTLKFEPVLSDSNFWMVVVVLLVLAPVKKHLNLMEPSGPPT
jgi:hypothetical protein